jgi:hypothetical protein
MIPALIGVGVIVAAALAFVAGWRLRAARAGREDGRMAYLRCGLLIAMRDRLLDAGRLAELRWHLTEAARSQFQLWRHSGRHSPVMAPSSAALFRKAQEEFEAEPDDDEIDDPDLIAFLRAQEGG